MTKLKIYNTLTRSKQEVKPIEGDIIRIYSCGLTVYDFAHIGNLRKYIFDDVLKRTLKFLGYKTKHVMNVTDVGHLTSDQDEGEDKIEKGAKRERKSAYDIARFYEKAFVADLKALRVQLPDIMPRATDNIKEQIDLVKKLEDKGFTYKTSDGIYFDTSKLKDYGKLSGLEKQELQEGVRVAKNEEKKNPSDFALWKLSSSQEGKRDMEWPSPWGVGFPGWHLECSVMSTKFLGQPFEIHTGGVDHIGVHHTNEIAQSEAAEDKPLAKYFVHSEHLLQDGRKMAKSEGHFLRLRDLEEKGFSPLDFRFMCLQAHYQSKLDFTWASLEGAKAARRRINDFYQDSSEGEETPVGLLEEFEGYISDNLDTPRALSLVFETITKTQKSEITKGALKSFLEKADEIFQILEEKKEIPQEVLELAKKRDNYRKSGDYQKADEIREEIVSMGYTVEDSGVLGRIIKK